MRETDAMIGHVTLTDRGTLRGEGRTCKILAISRMLPQRIRPGHPRPQTWVVVCHHTQTSKGDLLIQTIRVGLQGETILVGTRTRAIRVRHRTRAIRVCRQTRAISAGHPTQATRVEIWPLTWAGCLLLATWGKGCHLQIKVGTVTLRQTSRIRVSLQPGIQGLRQLQNPKLLRGE